MDLILAFSLQEQVEKYGAYVGLAAFLGLAVLSLLYFAQARELKRLRDWAGRAPERAQELEARVVAQAEEALREAESGATVPAAAASGNGGQVAAPAAIPMGPRPAVAAAAARAHAAQATVEAPVVPAVTEGDGPPPEDERAVVAAGEAEAAVPVEAEGGERAGVVAVPGEAEGDEPEAAAPGETAADDQAAPADDDRATVPAGEESGDAAADDQAAPADDDHATVPAADDETAESPGEEVAAPSDEDRAIVPAGWARADEAPVEDPPAEDEDREPEAEPARSGNGVPAAPPAQIPRATPRPQPRPAAAPLRAATPSRPVTVPPRRPAPGRSREGGSRVGLYTALGILVLAAAIFVPVYFMVLADDEEPAPQPNPIAEPGADPEAGGAGAQGSEARAETVVVVLNGTPVDGLASEERDALVAAGYSDEQGMLRIDNNPDQQCQDSIVYYSADGRRQARDVSRLLDITRTEEIDEETQALADSSDQSGTLPADVVALLCADKSP
jgi:hypothetical protein